MKPFSLLLEQRHRLYPDYEDRFSDADLLHRFVETGEDVAFDMLVQRHGPMVMSVCRRILEHLQDAEDTFQATFLVLARKAPSIRSPDLLANWLYGVAIRTARQARMLRSKRWNRQEAIPTESLAQTSSTLSTHQEAQLEWLDLEVSRLPKKYRLPVVLCELQGLSRKNAALQLGIPEGTLSSRLATARKLLNDRMSRRSPYKVGAGTDVLDALGQCDSRLEPTLRMRTTELRFMLSDNGNGQAQISSRVLTLGKGVLREMRINQIKIGTGIAFVVGVLALGLVSLWTTSVAGPVQPDPRNPAPQTEPAQKPRRVGQRQLKLPCRVDGIIEEVLVKEGQRIKRGDVLAKLDANIVLVDVELARLQFEKAKAELEFARSVWQESKTQSELAKQLLKNALISKEEFRMKTLVKTLAETKCRHQVRSAEVALKVAQMKHVQAKMQADMYRILAPVDGVVEAIYVGRGEGVRALEDVVFRIKTTPEK